MERGRERGEGEYLSTYLEYARLAETSGKVIEWRVLIKMRKCLVTLTQATKDEQGGMEPTQARRVGHGLDRDPSAAGTPGPPSRFLLHLRQCMPSHPVRLVSTEPISSRLHHLIIPMKPPLTAEFNWHGL